MLSAIVITKNEEKNISRCLRSLKFTDEIIVIDSNSHDRTVELAREQGAKVWQREWSGYGQQKNYGAAQAHGDWLLFIDADEEVSSALQKEIMAKTKTDVSYKIYWLREVTIFLGKPLRHLYGHNPRLFKKETANWTDEKVQEHMLRVHNGTRIGLGDKDTGLISEPLWHYSHNSVKSYLKKMHKYTSLDAQQMKLTGRHRSGRKIMAGWTLPYYLGGRQFSKLFFYRGGWLDGYAGWLWCLLSSYYEWEMADKFVRMTNLKSKVQNPNVK